MTSDRIIDERLFIFTKQGFLVGYITFPTIEMRSLALEIYQSMDEQPNETNSLIRERFLNLLDASAITFTYHSITGVIL